MKKIIALIFAIAIILSLCACGATNSPSSTPEPAAPTEKTGPTDEDLAKAADLIGHAQVDIDNAASNQLDGWTTYSSIMEYYFIDSKWQDASGEFQIYNRAKSIHFYRDSAERELAQAKELLGTNGTGDYYTAVKEYYKAVSVYYNLISEFPEGYSKITFSAAVKDNKAKCDEAFSEVSFYN